MPVSVVSEIITTLVAAKADPEVEPNYATSDAAVDGTTDGTAKTVATTGTTVKAVALPVFSGDRNHSHPWSSLTTTTTEALKLESSLR